MFMLCWDCNISNIAQNARLTSSRAAFSSEVFSSILNLVGLYQIYRLTNTIAFWCYITLTSDKPSHQLIGMQPTRRRTHLSLFQLIFACDWKMCCICICSAQYNPLLNLRWNDLALISDKPQRLSFKFIMWRKKTSNSDIKMSLSFTVCLLIKLLHTYENTHIYAAAARCVV